MFLQGVAHRDAPRAFINKERSERNLFAYHMWNIGAWLVFSHQKREGMNADITAEAIQLYVYLNKIT